MTIKTQSKDKTNKTSKVQLKKATIEQSKQIATYRESALSMVAKASQSPKVDIDKMRELLTMQERIEANMARNAYTMAMTGAQREMQPVAVNAQNTQTYSRYATLEAIDKAIRPIYTAYGFNLSFNSESLSNDMVKVMCHCSHNDGHITDHTLTGKLDAAGFKGNANKNPMQALGSTISYLQRYLTCMIFNIVIGRDDDDGQSSGQPVSQQANNKFQQRVNQDSRVTEAEYYEEPKFNGQIIVNGKVMNVQSDSAESAAKALKGFLLKYETKADREAIVNENLGLLHALKAENKTGAIQEIHATAGSGK